MGHLLGWNGLTCKDHSFKMLEHYYYFHFKIFLLRNDLPVTRFLLFQRQLVRFPRNYFRFEVLSCYRLNLSLACFVCFDEILNHIFTFDQHCRCDLIRVLTKRLTYYPEQSRKLLQVSLHRLNRLNVLDL